MGLNFQVIKKLIAAPEEPDEYDVVWRCYDCGSTKGFHTVTYETACGTEYDCECDSCGSVHTSEDGNGSPVCEDCGHYDWFCYKCNKCKCQECWEWFEVEEEPEDYVCPKCIDNRKVT